MLLFYLQNKVISNQVPFRYMGFSGRATYDYRNKYLFEFNIGYNGSENFAHGKRYGVFPAGRLGHHAGAIHEGRKVARPPQAARIVRSGG